MNANLIHTLHENAFLGLINLVDLRLNQNEITCVSKRLFDGMNAIENIAIGYNRLTSFLSASCPFVANETDLNPAQLPKLDKLFLRYNNLKEVPDLTGAPRLLSVELSFNELTDINIDHLAGLSKLKMLRFSHNRNMKHFPNISAILDPNDNSLTNIYANNIGISIINDEILVNLVNLDAIYVDSNNLQSLSFLSNQKLVIRTIYFRNNELANLSSMELASGSWAVLVRMDGEGNRITHISNVLLDQFPALQVLDLSGNRISIFPELTRIGSSLVNAYFNNNNISWIDVSSLVGLSNIVSLGLDENILTTFPLNVFAPVSTIRKVTLAKNRIQYVEELSPDVMASTDLEVTLTDNPFNCDQTMVWIKKLASSKLTMTLSSMPCSSPVGLTTTPWALVTVDDLTIGTFSGELTKI